MALFTERVQFHVPDGFIEAVNGIARQQHMTVSEFLRRAALERMEEFGVSLGAASSTDRAEGGAHT
jgi:Ribbon-helix-helix protein, copG family